LPEVVVNTSPLQYLHQLGILDVLHRLAGQAIIPAPVAEELAVGRQHGFDVPDPRAHPWMQIREPRWPEGLRLAIDLGTGEASVLAVALELNDPLVVLDDGLGRWVAKTLGIRLRGTLGILLDAKRVGYIPAVAPAIDRLQQLRFRVSPDTVALVLRLAGEGP
jgi:predicted nucleic acid-binding protein